MRDPWVWPDNPAYPPWPHLRYPLTSKDEDPNKKILARQSCSRERRTLLFYLTRTAYHALPHTKHANNSPTTRDTPILGCLLTRDPWVLPAKPDIPPHGRTSRSFIQKARGQYCFISLTQDTMHYLTQNTPPNPTIKGTHIRVPFGQDLWVWPDNPAYPPHSRTSATPSPQRMKILTKDLLGRVAHERRGHYCFISLTQNTTRVIYLRLSRPVLPRTR